MRDYRLRKSKNAGSGRPIATKKVIIRGSHEGRTKRSNPSYLLVSYDSEDCDGVKLVQVADEGSRSQLAHVIVQGVPADGMVDTGADITVTDQELFARVAAAVRLPKTNFQKPDKVPRTYDLKTFHLDGCMDMDVSFADNTLRATVYIKINAHNQLFLSKFVCWQLGIVSYHPSVSSRKGVKKAAALLSTV